MWTKNPIPPCARPDGSPFNEPMAVCPQPMFPPVLPGLFGDGPGACIVWGVHGPVEGYHKLYDSYGRLVHDGPCTKEEALNIALHFQFNIFDLVEIQKTFQLGSMCYPFAWMRSSLHKFGPNVLTSPSQKKTLRYVQLTLLAPRTV